MNMSETLEGLCGMTKSWALQTNSLSVALNNIWFWQNFEWHKSTCNLTLFGITY